MLHDSVLYKSIIDIDNDNDINAAQANTINTKEKFNMLLNILTS